MWSWSKGHLPSSLVEALNILYCIWTSLSPFCCIVVYPARGWRKVESAAVSWHVQKKYAMTLEHCCMKQYFIDHWTQFVTLYAQCGWCHWFQNIFEHTISIVFSWTTCPSSSPKQKVNHKFGYAPFFFHGECLPLPIASATTLIALAASSPFGAHEVLSKSFLTHCPSLVQVQLTGVRCTPPYSTA
jgi:hypothetical protein